MLRTKWFAAVGILLLPLGVFAQEKGKTPDLTGVWTARGLSATIFTKGDPLMTDWAKTEYAKAKPSFGPKMVTLDQTNDPVYKCFPPGVPRVYFHPFPLQIIEAPKMLLMFFEYDHTMRRVYTDGRKHNEDIDPTWMGDSIGHWEGDTLVVETTNQIAKSWIDRLGHPHSEQLRVVEKFKKTTADNLQVEVTLNDAKAYKEPFSVTFNMQLKPNWEVAEQNCIDNSNLDNLEKGALPK
ncbi:MAG: hypothetical protein ABL995_09780 [Bryobacteraceae bacterium]